MMYRTVCAPLKQSACFYIVFACFYRRAGTEGMPCVCVRDASAVVVIFPASRAVLFSSLSDVGLVFFILRLQFCIGVREESRCHGSVYETVMSRSRISL